jgi:hypothetical protein
MRYTNNNGEEIKERNDVLNERNKERKEEQRSN